MTTEKKILLPIHEKFDELKELLTNHQVIVVAGETGSGKTTQLPQLCYEMGYSRNAQIAVTQPRRIAATSTAKRVAEEMGSVLGEKVGYRIRFAEKTSKNTEVLFLTDGMLLSEMSHDKLLKKYNTIIIDEAHERSLNIDFLLGYFRKLIKMRPELKLIISSATIDTDLFSKAFDNAPIVQVSGRMFPVEMIYDPLDGGGETYIEKTCTAVDQIIGSDLDGDILIFMPTERDIMETVDKLTGRNMANTIILPLFARLTRYQQNRIFETTGERKIVVSTNIAETSLTVQGIRFVVDTGLARVSRYAPNLRTNRLPVEEVSQAEAKQRAGRCGRVAEGICIRLYDEKNLLARPDYRSPEIKRSNLAGVILSMLKMRLGDIERFPFLEAPDKRAISDAFSQLFELGAVNVKRVMTELGKKMSRLPLEPHISRMILQADREGVVEEVGIIAAGLSIVDPRERPTDLAAEADEMHKKFIDHRSDFVTLLKLWESYHRTLLDLRTQRKMRKYCVEHFLNFNRMQEWGDVHRQIIGILREKKIKSNSSFDGDTIKTSAIHRAICAGLVSSIARFDSEAKCYRATRNRLTYLFPGSVIAKKKNRPEWIMAQEIVETSRTFARGVGPIDPRWVEEFVPHLLKRIYGVPYYDEERGSVLVEERALFQGLEVSNGRSRFFGKINPSEAQEIFIRQALVEGRMVQPLPFLVHNLEIQERLSQEEAKLRITGCLLDEEALVLLYKEILPEGLASVRDLVGFIKKHKGDSFLRFTREELLVQELPTTGESLPEALTLGGKAFPLKYQYHPGKEDDGVTVTIPLGEIAYVRDTTFGWLVPALWPEKVSALLKTLPKAQRKQFVPVNEAGIKIAGAMVWGSHRFTEEMCRALKKVYSLPFKPSDFDETALPEHLQMRIAVADTKGNIVATTRNPDELLEINQTGGGKKEESEISRLLKKATKHTITTWDFGDLETQKEISRGTEGFILYGYPALVSQGRSCDLVYCANPQEAEKKHAKGVAHLVKIIVQQELDWVRKDLRCSKKLAVLANPYGGGERLTQRLYEIIEEAVLTPPESYILTQQDFESYLATKKNILQGAGFKALEKMETVLQLASDHRATLSKYHRKYPTGSYAELASELDGELELYLDQFMEGYFPYELLLRFDSYMKAFGWRIEKAFLSTPQYRQSESLLLEHQNRIVEFVENSHQLSSKGERHLLDYICMVEEYALHLFAHPHMKPAMPVSEKRLQKCIDKVEECQV